MEGSEEVVKTEVLNFRIRSLNASSSRCSLVCDGRRRTSRTGRRSCCDTNQRRQCSASRRARLRWARRTLRSNGFSKNSLGSAGSISSRNSCGWRFDASDLSSLRSSFSGRETARVSMSLRKALTKAVRATSALTGKTERASQKLASPCRLHAAER